MSKILKALLLIFASMISLKSQSQPNGCKLKQRYFPSGKVKEEGCEKNGQKEGVWKDYTEQGGKHYVRFIWTYKKGLKDGPYRVLGETGKVEATGIYSADQLADTVKSFNDEGQLTNYSVWKINNLVHTSEQIFEKTIIAPEKPDYTVENIDGRMYMWMSGRKLTVTTPKLSSADSAELIKYLQDNQGQLKK